jgi:hypothetical protein
VIGQLHGHITYWIGVCWAPQLAWTLWGGEKKSCPSTGSRTHLYCCSACGQPRYPGLPKKTRKQKQVCTHVTEHRIGLKYNYIRAEKTDYSIAFVKSQLLLLYFLLFCGASEVLGILFVVCSTLAGVVGSLPECPLSLMKAHCL